MKKIIYKLLISLLGQRKFYIILEAIVNKYYPYKILKFYRGKKCHSEYKEKTVVYMADGKLRHEGLSDILKGIVYTYYACLEKSYSFKIYFVHPFNIENFLEPNIYDCIDFCK